VIVTDFELLLHELGRLPEMLPRHRVISLLRSFSGRRLTIDGRLMDRLDRVRTASSMLETGMDRAEACRALQARLGVSERTAQRLICSALSLRMKARIERLA